MQVNAAKDYSFGDAENHDRGCRIRYQVSKEGSLLGRLMMYFDNVQQKVEYFLFEWSRQSETTRNRVCLDEKM